MVRADSAGSTLPHAAFSNAGENFQLLVGLLPLAVYTCEGPSGVITFFNDHAVKLWGRRPRAGDSDERFCGSFRLYRPDGRVLPHDQTPMAVALIEGTPARNQEVIIERPDGTRITVLVNIDPIREEGGRVIGAINAFHEITALQQAEQAAAHLAAIVDSSEDAIISKNLSSIIQTWNKSAERIFGYTADEAVGKPITIIIPPERHGEEAGIIARLKRGERIEHFETIRMRKDGALLDISLTISPVKDAQGQIIGASKIARDITEHKRMEQVLADLQQRYAMSLEEKVKRTSAELSQSQERLRMAERMASLGTLSAGLGHDLGNVLMPLRAHVDALASHLPGGNGSQDHLDAIRKSMEYLHTLAGGLRMLAIDPSLRDGRAAHRLYLHEWWARSEPILRTALGRHISLEHDIDADLPPVPLPIHMLTQAVFNLVQNTAQAMAGPRQQTTGTVRISAVQEGGEVLLRVQDNGPGMSEEVRRRCLEPYFTTKSRGISTGLGLTLVHGIVQSARGSLDIESQPGRGTTITLRLPVAEPAKESCAAVVRLHQYRLAALLTHLMQSLGLKTCSEDDQSNLMITDDPQAAGDFLARNPQGRAIVFTEALAFDTSRDRFIHLTPGAKTAEIRAALTAAIGDD